MDFNLLTDEDIIKELASRYDYSRLNKKLSEKDVSDKGGTNSDAIYRFKNGKNISLTNFIKILRGVGELDKLEKLLKTDEYQSIREVKKAKTPKRIFKSRKKDSKNNKDFIWEEDK